MKSIEGGLCTRGQFARKSEPMMPLVTIITVVYNGAEHLEHTIRSVLGQTYENIEYIIIDGGSTDGTLDIIKRFDDQIAYWLSEPDKGIYDAMNKGIDLANGDWINFMNAGDGFCQTDSVQRVISSNCNTADLIYGHCQIIYGPDFSLIWKAQKKIQDLWKGMIFRHQSLFTRRSICKKHYFDLSYRIGADFEFIYNCYQADAQFCCLDLTIAAVTVGGFSDARFIQAITENRRTVIQYHNSIKVNLYYLGQIIFIGLKSLIKKVLPKDLKQQARIFKYR
jgi:glycosyltransferase involved in cell wall biosynthesis